MGRDHLTSSPSSACARFALRSGPTCANHSHNGPITAGVAHPKSVILAHFSTAASKRGADWYEDLKPFETLAHYFIPYDMEAAVEKWARVTDLGCATPAVMGPL